MFETSAAQVCALLVTFRPALGHLDFAASISNGSMSTIFSTFSTFVFYKWFAWPDTERVKDSRRRPFGLQPGWTHPFGCGRDLRHWVIRWMIRWTMLVPPTLPLRLERTPLELGLLPTFGSTQLSCKAKVTFLGAFSILLYQRGLHVFLFDLYRSSLIALPPSSISF